MHSDKEAQIPSNISILNQIKSIFTEAKVVKLEAKGTCQKIFEKGVWKYYYKRKFKVLFNSSTNLNNINAIIHYIKVGKRFVFNHYIETNMKNKNP